MAWLERLFDDDPAPEVARDRLIERITENSVFERHRKQVKRGFIEPRLEFPTVSSADDVLGERMGVALRLLAGGNEDDPRGVLSTVETRVNLAAGILRAVPFLWRNDQWAAASGIAVPETVISHDLLPFETMWWTYEDSPRLISPGQADIVLDGRFVQRERGMVTWFDVGSRGERFYVEPFGFRTDQVYPGDTDDRHAPPVIAALAYLRVPTVLVIEERSTQGDVDDLDENVVRVVNSMTPGSPAPGRH